MVRGILVDKSEEDRTNHRRKDLKTLTKRGHLANLRTQGMHTPERFRVRYAIGFHFIMATRRMMQDR